MNYQVIDIKNWDRQKHYLAYQDYLEPCFCITAQVEVTAYFKMLKEKGYSITFGILHAVAMTVNQVETFRYRIVGDQVRLYDQIQPVTTYTDQDSGLFKLLKIPMTDDLAEFNQRGRQLANDQKDHFPQLSPDVFISSPMPEFNFLHKSHTIPDKKNNSTIYIDWGKIHEQGEKLFMPMSIQVNHALADGNHVSLFFKKIQARFNLKD